MSYGICRCQKVKGAGAGAGSYIHNERKKDVSHTNPDIDFERSGQNYSFGKYNTDLDYNQRAEERIKEGYKGKKAIRKDAVKQVEFIFTSDSEFFNAQADGGKEYLQDCYNWACERYGKDNIIADTVHLDETTPHMHLHIVPLTEDGRLSCKDVIGSRQDLQQMQDAFYKDVSSKYGLERGDRYDFDKEAQGIEQERPRAHKTLARMKQEESRELEELKRTIDGRKNQFEKWEQRLSEDKRELAEVIRQLQLKEQELTKLENAVLSEKERLNVVQDDFRTKTSQIVDLSRQKTSLERECNSLKKEYISLSHDKAELQVNYDALKMAFSDLNARYSKAKNYIAELLKDIRDIPAFVSQFKSRLSRPTIEVISEFERSQSEYDPAEDPFYKSTPKKKNRSR